MPALTIIDAVDILIVAFFIYKLMMMIRGTRATAILKGLAVLLGANALSGFLGLRTINYILQQGTTVILVALPVLFFPELRRALEQLGRGQLFTGLTGYGTEEQKATVDMITRAASLMADSNTGALIVIERDVGLEEYIESGVRMDGVLSIELLLNLFAPTTPLHDGAVIVRGDRISAAGCFLPLTDKPHVSSDIGTRHRAGMGISEHSDALVVLVSEETGAISFVEGGHMERNLTEEQLAGRLTEGLKRQTGFSLMKWMKSR